MDMLPKPPIVGESIISTENISKSQVQPVIPPSPFPSFGGLGLATKFGTGLKKKESPTPFKLLNVYDPINQWKQCSMDDRMRFIDLVRKYTPLPEECDDLHMANQRYDLHTVKSALYLSGACISVRFTTENLQSLQSLLLLLGPIYELLDTDFKKHSSKTKKLKFKSIPSTFFDSDKYKNIIIQPSIPHPTATTTIATAINTNTNHPNPSLILNMDILNYFEFTSADIIISFLSDEINNSTLLNMNSLHIHSTIPTTTATTVTTTTSATVAVDENIVIDVFRFQLLADYYLYLLNQVHALILEKQKEIPPPEDRALSFDKDKDPDALFGKKYPDWLSLFIEKYNTIRTAKQQQQQDALKTTAVCSDGNAIDEKSNTAAITTTVSPVIIVKPVIPKKEPIMSVGKLAALLSCCIVGAVSCSEEELNALDEVLHASNDCSIQFYTRSHNIATATMEANNANTTTNHDTATTNNHNINNSTNTNNNAATITSPPPATVTATTTTTTATNSMDITNNNTNNHSNHNMFLKMSGNHQEYWSKRMFDFLSPLTELKSWPKDEASMNNYAFFIQ